MRRFGAFIVLALSLIAVKAVWAQAGQDVPAEEQQQQQLLLLDEAQLDQLVAPIALYPDPLLAQVLMASTYPLEIVQADRWAKANKGLKGDKLAGALAKQDRDPSVKELVSTPTVLDVMNDQLDWTQKLGDAVLAQQADVMDAVQRLRAKAEANGKLETTKEQKVTVKQEAEGSAPIIEIEPSSPDVVYVPYYDPAVVYGEWSYPDYPPYYYPPPPGYIVGGAIATGLAWGAAYAIGREIWDDIDWHRGDIDIDIDRNLNIDRNVERNFNKWEHNSYHRRGVAYDNDALKSKFAKAGERAPDRKLDYRGRSGDQVLKPDNKLPGDRKPGAGGKPDLGQIQQGLKERAGKPDAGQIQQGLKDRGGKTAALDKKPDLGKAKSKIKPGGNAFDLSDGPKAKDFSKRGHASLGDRGARDFSAPKAKAIQRGGARPNIARGGGHVARGGGGRGGGGRGGGRRSDIQLKQDVVLVKHLADGINLYRFRYKGSDHNLYVGVMAQEVRAKHPDAVSYGADGYLRVDYDRIGVKFMTWQEWLARDHALQVGAAP